MRRLREEDGAIAVIVSLLICFLMVPLAALAVDIGVQRVARRDMQSLADVVALDLSRDVDGTRSVAAVLTAWGCTVNTTGTCDAASTNRVGRSVDRNTTTLGDAPTVRARLVCADDAGVLHAIGTDPDGAGPAPVCANPDAVEVGSETAVDFNIMGGRGGAHRTALGRGKQTACFNLGSFAARFRTNDSTLLQKNGGALNDLLGVNLDIVSYQGLTAAEVSLADLAATSQIGGVDQLLGGSVTLRNIFAATYAVLNAQGEPENAVALNVLNNPAAWLGGNLDAVVNLGQLIGVTTTDNAALKGEYNVLDLLAGAIALANGENALSLTDLGLVGITDPALSHVKVIQGMQGPICGKVGEAHGTNSQIDVVLAGNLGSLGLAGLINASSVNGTYAVDVKLGGAEGRLTGSEPGFPSVHCGSSTAVDPAKYNVTMSSALAKVALDARVRVQGSTTNIGSVANVPLLSNLVNSLLGGLLGQVLRVDYDLTVGFAAQTATSPNGTVHLQVPLNAINNESPVPPGVPVSVAADAPLALPALPATPAVTGTITVTSSKISLLGIPLGTDTRQIAFDAATFQPLVNAVTSAVSANAVLDTVSDAVNDEIADLAGLLGLGFGGADVYSHDRPTCRGAELIG